jgi:hypothetical protein
MVAVAWLFWLSARDREATFARFPALQTGMAAVGGRLQGVEQRLRAWDREAFGERLAKIEQGVEARLHRSGKAAEEAVSVAAGKLRDEFGRRSTRVESRVADLERERDADKVRLAAVQDELARVKQELAQQEVRAAASERNLASDKEALEQAFDRRLSDVRRGVQDNQREVASVAKSIEVRRVDFEASRNHTRQLAPGISLCVTATDVSRRRINGWMWVMPDRRTVWLKDHGALQPVIFYSKADGKKREVVFTHLTRDSVVGYLLLPGTAPVEGARDAGAGALPVPAGSE